MKQPIQTILFCFVFAISFNGIAQDTLFFMNHDTLLTKVISIKQKEIQYKKFSNLDGPSYYIETEKVNRIVYPNGGVDEFNFLLPKSRYSKESVVIILVDGEKIDALLYEVNAQNITYKRKGNPDGPEYHKSMHKVHKIVYSSEKEQVFNDLSKSKKQVQPKTESKVIKVTWSSYFIAGHRISSKKVEEKLREMDDPEINKLLKEASQVKVLSNLLGYSSAGFAIYGLGSAFVGLIIRASSSDNIVLVLSGWSGAAALVTVVGSGVMKPVYKDRMKRAIALYNEKVTP